MSPIKLITWAETSAGRSWEQEEGSEDARFGWLVGYEMSHNHILTSVLKKHLLGNLKFHNLFSLSIYRFVWCREDHGEHGSGGVTWCVTAFPATALTGTTSVKGWTRTWVSAQRTGKRTFDALLRWPGFLLMLGWSALPASSLPTTGWVSHQWKHQRLSERSRWW